MEQLMLKYYAIGHSYLKHGPFVGWQTVGEWGMAATAPEKDYYHRLLALLQENFNCKIESVAENHAGFERLCKPGVTREQYWDSEPYRHIKAQLEAFKPNVITVFVGANCIGREPEEMRLFYDVLYGLLAACKTKHTVVLAVHSATWSAVKAAASAEMAQKYGFIPVDISEVHAKKREENPYYAFEQYPDYQGAVEFRTHPGDLGHAYIAKQIFEQLKPVLPTRAEEGAPLQTEKAQTKQSKHTAGKWYFDHLNETADLEIGGFNLRVENSMLKLSAAVDTGLSVGCKGLALPCKELRIKAAVEGDAQTLRITVYGEKEVCFAEALLDAAMHEYCYKIGQTVTGFSIAPDGLDCCINIDEIVFEEE